MRYDLTIVGGGIVGSCVAYMASKMRPDWQIITLEQANFGGGASMTSAGFDAVESVNPRLRDLAIRSRLLYREMSPEIGAAAVEHLDTYWVIDKSDGKNFPSRFVSESGDFSLIDRADLPQHLSIRLNKNQMIFRDGWNGYARPSEICRGVRDHLRKSRSNHFMAWEGVEVISISNAPNGCEVLLRDGRTVLARHVVVATGAWLLNPAFKAILPRSPTLRCKKIGGLCIDCVPAPLSPAVVFQDEGAFLLPLHRHDQWIFSFTLNTWDCWLGAATLTLEPEELHHGISLLTALSPPLAESVGGARVGFDLYTPDRIPLVYSPRAMRNVTVATGFSGAGYRVAPALATEIIAQITSQSLQRL